MKSSPTPAIYQAIETRYLPPTNTRPARIVAECDRGRAILSWEDGMNADANHICAAKRLCARFAEADKAQYGTPLNENTWSRHFVTGATKKGYVHVFQS